MNCDFVLSKGSELNVLWLDKKDTVVFPSILNSYENDSAII